MQNMDVRKLLISTLIIFASVLETESAFALTGDWLIGLSGGGTKTRLQNSHTSVSNGSTVAAPYNIDTFSINNPSDTATMALFGGHQWQRENSFLPYYSLVLNYEHLFSTNINGTVQQYGLPQFKNYNYSMKVQSDILNIVGKIDLIQYKFILPYLSAGVGVAFNQVRNYNEQAIPPVSPARVSPNYNNKTNTNFAYSVGAGIDLICYKNLWVTLGYQFMDLGKVNSGSGSGTWSGTQLSFGTLTSHTILGSITYLF